MLNDKGKRLHTWISRTQSNTLGMVSAPGSIGAKAGASSGSAALGSEGPWIKGADGASSSSQTSDPSPAGTQRGPALRPAPLGRVLHEITPPRAWIQVKLRPEGEEQVMVLPRLRTQVRVSPPSQPSQVWVPSELSVQNTSKLEAWTGSIQANRLSNTKNGTERAGPEIAEN